MRIAPAALGVLVLPLLAVPLTAQFVAVDQSSARRMTRVLWLGGERAQSLSIEFGQPEWRDTYNAFLESNDAAHVRLGTDAWTTWQSNIDASIGSKRIKAGRWYLGVSRKEDRKWSLTLMAAEKIDAAGTTAGETVNVTPDLSVPLSYAATNRFEQQLTIELDSDPKQKSQVALRIAWGKHRLSTTITADIDDSVPPGVPEFRASPQERVETTASGLQFEQVRAGAGKFPTPTDQVTVHYTGWLEDGTLFDSSHQRGKPVTLPLSGVIKGWTEGLQLMQPGATFQFRIPSELAYGQRGAGPLVPPNATLVFRVTLISIE